MDTLTITKINEFLQGMVAASAAIFIWAAFFYEFYPKTSEPELCPHGVEWDECPDCCH